MKRGRRRVTHRDRSMRPAIVSAVLATALLATSPARLEAQAPPTDTLTLASALTAALDRDPELAAARASVSAAAAGQTQARSAWLPSLTTSGMVTRFQEPMVVAPLHQFDPRTPPAFDRTLAQGRLTVGWTVFDGGARSARVTAAGARVAGADAGAAQARADATLELIDAYLRVLGARDASAAQRTRESQLEEERARACSGVTDCATRASRGRSPNGDGSA